MASARIGKGGSARAGRTVPTSAPVNTVAPAITGTLTVGEILTCSDGTWTGNPTPTFTYQWQRCDGAGTNCVNISSSTNSTRTLSAADEDATLKCTVTATNAVGNASATTSATATVSAGSGTTPLSRNEHPRMWATEDNIAAMRTRVATGGALNGACQGWIDWIDLNYNTSWGFTDLSYWPAHPAYAYLLLRDGAITGITPDHTASEYGNKAADALLELISDGAGQLSDDRNLHAIVSYDWAWPFFSAAERNTVEDWLKTVKAYDTTQAFNVVQTSRAMARIMAGLAIMGDGLDDTWAQARIDEYDDYFSSTSTGTTYLQSLYGGDDGANGEGPSYAYAYHNEWQVLLEEAWRTANGISLATHYNTSERTMLTAQTKEIAYRILPFAVSSNWILEKGQYFLTPTGAADGTFRNWVQLARGLYAHDTNITQLAQWLCDNKLGGTTTSGDQGYLRWFVPGVLVFGPATAPSATSPTALGLPSTRLSDDGRFIFRDDWTSGNAAYITFDASKYFTSPYHSIAFGPGTWQIHRRGPQIVNQGGATGHDWGGGRNAGSCNCLTFVNTDISITGGIADGRPGGNINNSSSPLSIYEDLQGPQHRLVYTYVDNANDFTQNSFYDARDDFAYVLADRAAGRDFDYVLADLTRSYPSARQATPEVDNRVSEVIRQFVYLRPATAASSDPDFVFVFDRATTTHTKWERRNIIHTSTDPTIDGSAAAGPTRNGTTEGKTTYTGATVITANNTVNSSDGKVFITPLLPAAFSIVKVGGNDGSGNPWTDNSHEYESPYGVLWTYTRGGISPSSNESQYIGGRFRCEIIPTTSNLTDAHLYVVEAANAGATQTAVTGISLAGSTFVGAAVGDRVVLFHKTSAAVTSGTFVLPATGTWRVLITCLAPGTTRTVTGGANIGTISSIDPVDAGSPFVVNTPTYDSVTSGTAGWLYLTIPVNTVGSGVANTITIS